jgi:hypothetical protein
MNDPARHAFWLCCAAVILLVAALLPIWPYAYYRLLRIFVCGSGAYVAVLLWRADRIAFAGAAHRFRPNC